MLPPGAQAQLCAALRVLATEEAYPVAFHCTAGKDRTGVLSPGRVCHCVPVSTERA